MPASAPRSRTRLGSYTNIARAVALALVFGFAVVGLLSGVSLTERDLSDAHLLAYFYYALSLFVVGGVDLGTPTGGPLWGRTLLWLAYFCAPLITVSAVLEAVLRLLDPHSRRMRKVHDHIVVCGGGRLALLFVRELRAHDERVAIVVVEHDANKASLREFRDVHRAEVVIGNTASDEILSHARIEHARRVMLLTGDDFSNLDAAARIVTRLPDLHGRVVAHVADLAFMRAIPAGVEASGYETFNSLESAAVHLVQNRLSGVFEATAHRDLVVFAGFGRFGQTVLHQLRERADDGFGTVIVLDLEAQAHARRFADGPGFGHHPHYVVEGHLRDVERWREIHARIASDSDGPPVIVVGTGDEGTNLQAALDLRRRYPDAHITVRSFSASPFASAVADQLDIEPLVLAELIASAMPRRWFAELAR